MRMNKKEERGYTWKLPLDGEKGAKGEPLTKMEKKVDKVKDMTH